MRLAAIGSNSSGALVLRQERQVPARRRLIPVEVVPADRKTGEVGSSGLSGFAVLVSRGHVRSPSPQAKLAAQALHLHRNAERA